MKSKKEFLIGLFTTVVLVLFYFGFNFLKGEDLFSDDKEYIVVYNKISGLNVANPVKINGHKVGQISEVFMDPSDSLMRIRVKFKLPEEFNIPIDSRAVIVSDLLGVNSIDLELGKSSTIAQAGDTLSSAMATTIQEEVEMQVLPIKLKTEELLGSIDSILGVIQFVFNSETQTNLIKSIESIQYTLQNLESATASVDDMVITEKQRLASILSNIENITSTLNKNDSLVELAIQNFANLSDSISRIQVKQTMDNVNKVAADLAVVTSKISSGEGSLGQLVHNDTLYYELQETAKELHMLTEDLKLHPERYVHVSVFGRNPKKNQYQEPDKKKEK